jgi:phosphoribosylglycinamide formyltransferase 1
VTARIVVLASGSGSNLAAILDACAAGTIDAQVVAVVSDRPSARALERAADAGVPALPFPRLPGEERRDYDTRLADTVAMYAPQWVVLAGWMRLLTMPFLGRFPSRVVNLHPALPGTFPGIHAIERAHLAAVAGHLDHTGVMVHLVPDEGVDDGPVLATAIVPIDVSQPLEVLEARMHAVEHELLVSVLRGLCCRQTARTA